MVEAFTPTISCGGSIVCSSSVDGILHRLYYSIPEVMRCSGQTNFKPILGNVPHEADTPAKPERRPTGDHDDDFTKT